MRQRLAACLLALGMLGSHAWAQAPATTPAPAQAQSSQLNPAQPGNNAPVWREVRKGQAGYASLPDREAGVLILTEGQAWRQLRNGPITWIGGALLIGVVVLLAAFYLWRGPIRLAHARTGRPILRFRHLERVAHWTTAITFVILAVTGILMLFGKHVLMPLFGHTLHGYLLILGKNVHNFVGPVFSVALLFVIAMFIRDNVPSKRDWQWLKSAGGMFGGPHVPAGRFNAMQKALFWSGVVGLGVIVTVSGYVLDFPNLDQLRTTMQTAHVVHAVAALLMIAMMLAHIYIGTVGMEGAYAAMRTGYVDEAWAREHHEDWYQEVKDKPQTEPRSTPQPAVGPAAKGTV